MTQGEWPQQEPQGFVGPGGELAFPGSHLPDRGFGTGALLRLHLRTSRGVAFRPVFTVDGRTELTDWTSVDIPMAPGRHRVGAGVSSDVRYNATLDVNLAPGQVVDVFYATGPLEGRIALQPIKARAMNGCGAAALIGLVMMLAVFVVIMVVVFLSAS